MAQITLKTTTGADAGSVELDDAVFGIQPNVPVMHQVVTAQLANRRAGTQSHEDPQRGPWRRCQAVPPEGHRQRPPGLDELTALHRRWRRPRPEAAQLRPTHPEEDDQARPRSALSDRASEGKVVVLDRWGFDAPKTKDATAALSSLGVEGRGARRHRLVGVAVALSFRNLPEVQLIKVGELNAYDVLCNDWIVFEQGLLPTADAATKAVRRGR